MYETADGYQNLVHEKMKEIQDYEETSSQFQIYNKQTGSEFTYRDIKDMLLDTINKIMDIKRLMRQIIALDLATNYYLKKPSSQWILAGLTNIRLQIIDLKGVPIT